MNYSAVSVPTTRPVRPVYRKNTRARKQAQIRHIIQLMMIVVPVIILTAILCNLFMGIDGVSAVDSSTDKAFADPHKGGNAGSDLGGLVTNLGFEGKYTEDKAEKQTEQQKEAPKLYTQEDVALIAKTIWGEARGVKSDMEKSAVIWCILNRVDGKGYACGNSIEYVVTFPKQFHGYSECNPVTPELEALVRDVLDRWSLEKQGVEDVGRILPKDYIYFEGDGKHNHFTNEYGSTDYWDWSLPNPYED